MKMRSSYKREGNSSSSSSSSATGCQIPPLSTTTVMTPAASSSSHSLPHQSTASNASGESKQATPAFLEKLFDILDENSPYSHLISWQPDGASFIIKKVHEFSETVLPKYFKHSNIQSYIRQLNMYGFSKTRHDSTHREFTHKLFRRGRRDLLPLIKRKSQQNHNHMNAMIDLATGDQLLAISSPNKLPDYDQFKVSDPLPEDGDMNQSDHSSDSYRAKVAYLEQKVHLMSNLYYNLAHKHNLLCEALQLLQEKRSANQTEEGGKGEGDLVDEEGEGEQSPNVGGTDSEQTTSLSLPDSKSEASNGVTVPQTVLDNSFLTASEIDNFGGCLLRRMPSMNSCYDDPVKDQKESKQKGSTPSKRALFSCENERKLKRSKSADLRARMEGNHSMEINYLSFKANVNEIEGLLDQPNHSLGLQCSKFGRRKNNNLLKKSFSMEMPGIDAIATAASLLDSQDSQSLRPVASGTLLDLGEDGLSGKYLLSQGGGVLKKAFSYGPESSRF